MSEERNPISKAIFGDPDEEVIKAGTLNVTRGAGVLAAAAAGLTALGKWPFVLNNEQKIQISLTVLAIWAFIAAFDTLARGLATAAQLRADAAVKAAAVVAAGFQGRGFASP